MQLADVLPNIGYKMRNIDRQMVESLQTQAKESHRLRKNLNFHTFPSDPLQRMLNAIEPNSYVHPHRHIDPPKREMFLILTGRVAVFIFDNGGNVLNFTVLDAATQNYGIEILPHEWHTIVSLSPGSIVFEVKDGPYDADVDKWFAPWAPEPDTQEAIDYLNHLKGICSG